MIKRLIYRQLHLRIVTNLIAGVKTLTTYFLKTYHSKNFAPSKKEA